MRSNGVSANSYIYNERSTNALFIRSLNATDKDLCEAIASGGLRRQQAIESVYHWHELKQKVMNYVMRNNGDRSDGLDVFHDGIVALDRNIRENKFRGESELQGYLYSICRYSWNNERRKRAKSQSDEIQEHQIKPDVNTPEAILFSSEKKKLLGEVLNLLDDSCRKILTLWKLSYSMIEIAEQLSLSSPQMAKKYRYRCMKKLMITLKNSAHLLKALKNV